MFQGMFGDLFRGEFNPGLKSIDGFMLCTVIAEDAFDILHPADEDNVGDQDQDTDDTFDQVGYPTALDIEPVKYFP